MKKLILFFIIIVCAYLIFRKTSEFSPQKAAPKTQNHAWDVHPSTSEEVDEIHAICNQKFHYYGCGNQAFIFFSDDQNTVLKLLRQKRYRPAWWVNLLPPFFSYKARKIEQKLTNRKNDFTSYQLAFDRLQAETGLLLVHLTDTPIFDHRVVLTFDGREVEVELGEYGFILQRRGKHVYSALREWIEAGEIEVAKQAIDSLLTLFKSRCEKGIADRVPNIEKNFAFYGTEALQIDIGRFSLGSTTYPVMRQEFREWLKAKSPELSDYFEKQYLNMVNFSSL